MIGRKIWRYTKLCGERLPRKSPSVDYRSGVLSFGSYKDTTDRGGIRRRSGERLPTRVESGKLNVPITRVQPRKDKSGSPPRRWGAHPRGLSVFSWETGFAGA